MTINGQLRALTSSEIPFYYYPPETLRLSRIYPRGGPRAGGTAVTAWGTGFRDLRGAGSHGLYCKFGDADLSPATMVDESAHSLTCLSPLLHEDEMCQSVEVFITDNAHNPLSNASLSPDTVYYAYYETDRGVTDGTSTPDGATITDWAMQAEAPYWTGEDTT